MREALAHNRVLQHVLFWIVAITGITIIYGSGLPGYWFTLGIVCLCVPAQILYFYSVAYIGMPRLLFREKYLAFILFLIVCMLTFGWMFRLTEILIVDPMILAKIKKTKPDFKWAKLDGSFTEQLQKANFFILAIEQTNIVVWVAIAVKFFKMWYEKRQVALQAELSFLKGQVHPHFLFNTLNNLYALTLNQSPQSPKIVLGLSEILRYMLYECNADTVMLKRDIEILESYVALEKIRYEHRLELSFSINGEIADHKIAPLLVLPLLENAFKHGASEDMDTPWININLQVKDNLFKFKIANSKPEQQPHDAKKHFGKIGLGNVRKRLELLYPGAHLLRTVEEEDTFLAILEIQLDGHINI